MAATKILGSSNPVETGRSNTEGSSNACTVEVEGSYDLIMKARAETYVPDGYFYDSCTRISTGDGMGKLSVLCRKYDTSGSFGADRTTFSVDMQEVTYDLEDHPHLAESRSVCVKWVSDGCICRDDSYYTLNEDGEEEVVDDELALKFCQAYTAGIKTFVRFFPVISKISTYKNPPGMSMTGTSFSGGSPTFSNNIGQFDSPPLSLNGFPSNNWFKSKDSWEESANRSWRRIEQWTYTPDGSDSDHAWIYTEMGTD